MTWKSAEGEPLTMVMERGLPTVYALVNMDPGTMEPRAVALLIGEEWVDAGKLLIARIKNIEEKGTFTRIRIGICLVDF